MKLPYHNKAFIEIEKLTEYILSETHLIGRLKAKFFRKYGFNETNISALEKALLKIAISEEVKSASISSYGTKYILEGNIKTPKQKIIKLRTVWIIEVNQRKPRFVTAYPV